MTSTSCRLLPEMPSQCSRIRPTLSTSTSRSLPPAHTPTRLRDRAQIPAPEQHRKLPPQALVAGPCNRQLSFTVTCKSIVHSANHGAGLHPSRRPGGAGAHGAAWTVTMQTVRSYKGV